MMMPVGAWAQTGVVKSWDFTQAMPTDDKTHLDAELAKTEGEKIWVQDGSNANTYMNNTTYEDFTELTADGTNTIAFTKGLLFKIGYINNVRIYQQNTKKYIQMKDGVQIKIPGLKKGWSVKISAQPSKAEYTLSFDSDQLTQVSKDQDNKTIVSKVTTTGDVVFTINSKKTSDNSGQNILVYSITILPYTETPVKSWDFTSFADDDITNLNADAPAGAGDPVAYSDGTYWKRNTNDNRYYNVSALSNVEMKAKNGETDYTLKTTEGIYFTAVKNGGVRIYNDSKYMYIDQKNESKDNSFKINLHKGEKIIIDAKTTSGSNAAKISTTAVSGISSSNSAVTDRTDFVFYVSEDGDYTFYADGYSMYLYGITITSISATTEIGTSGYASFSSQNALDFTGISDIKAYIATAVTDGKVTLEQVTGAVPANTGLILEGESGASAVIPILSSADALGSTNLMVAVPASMTLEKAATGTNYVLAKNKTTGNAVFAAINAKSASLSAGMAYLHVSGAGAPSMLEFYFNGDDNITGIEELKDSKIEKSSSNAFYNLNGQRVAHPTKGLYIVNGKKYIVK